MLKQLAAGVSFVNLKIRMLQVLEFFPEKLKETPLVPKRTMLLVYLSSLFHIYHGYTFMCIVRI